MPIYINNSGAVNGVYLGSDEVYAMFFGADLVYLKRYFVSTTGGAYSFNIPSVGWYQVNMVGGGGGAGGGSWKDGHKHAGYCGGSGAGFVGQVYLQPGTYTIGVGGAGAGGAAHSSAGDYGNDGGNSYLALNGTNLIYCQGGAAGMGARMSASAGRRPTGQGGTLSVGNIQTRNVQVYANGNQGQGQDGHPGGASVYAGYGMGGDGAYKSNGGNGATGYVLLKLIGG